MPSNGHYNKPDNKKTVEELEQEIIATFDALPSIDEKYTLLFHLGDSLPQMDPKLKTETNRVKGCQSELWFHLHEEDQRMYLKTDSDSMVIKGIAALLVRLVAGREPEDIQKISLDFIDQMSIWKLASERNNGLLAMINHIHQKAEELALQLNGKEKGQTPS